MPQPPLTNREYAYICISGPGTHEDITQLLGLTPSEAWNVGDINARNGRPRIDMCWMLKSGYDDTHAMSLHIESLLSFLATRAAQVRQLWIDYDLILQCVGYYVPSGHGQHLSREVVRQAAQLGLAIDMDFYYVDDSARD